MTFKVESFDFRVNLIEISEKNWSVC